VVTFSTAGNHGFTNGNTVVIQGYTGVNVGLNGTFTITSVGVPDSTSFTVANNTPGLPASITTLAEGAAQGYAISLNSANGPTGLNGGQRSNVDAVAYAFAVPVSLSFSDFAMGTFAPTVGTSVSPPAPAVDYPGRVLTSPDGGITWVVSWTTAGGGGTGGSVIGHSMADGVYDITLTNSDRATDRFYRLFGDITGFSAGSARVNNNDNLQMSNAAFPASPYNAAPFRAGFDFNSDGIINNTDSLQFNNRYVSTWTGFAPTI
jgi:hypothetical protein